MGTLGTGPGRTGRILDSRPATAPGGTLRAVVAIILVLVPVVVLCILIALINNGAHYAPQAYYRRKRGGAPLAYGFESLGPRPRRSAPGRDEAGDEPPPDAP